jgi:hypothetical protein
LISLILHGAGGSVQTRKKGWKNAVSGDQKSRFLSVLPIDGE